VIFFISHFITSKLCFYLKVIVCAGYYQIPQQLNCWKLFGHFFSFNSSPTIEYYAGLNITWKDVKNFCFRTSPRTDKELLYFRTCSFIISKYIHILRAKGFWTVIKAANKSYKWSFVCTGCVDSIHSISIMSNKNIFSCNIQHISIQYL
jgi:hypothetical protein